MRKEGRIRLRPGLARMWWAIESDEINGVYVESLDSWWRDWSCKVERSGVKQEEE